MSIERGGSGGGVHGLLVRHVVAKVGTKAGKERSNATCDISSGGKTEDGSFGGLLVLGAKGRLLVRGRSGCLGLCLLERVRCCKGSRKLGKLLLV